MEGQCGGKCENYEGRVVWLRQVKGKGSQVGCLILTHHKVAAEVVLSPLLVPLAHGLHPLDKLSQDAGLVHPSVLFERAPLLKKKRKETIPKLARGQKTKNKTIREKKKGKGRGNK